MSRYKSIHVETANGSLKQLHFIGLSFAIWKTVVILELMRAPKSDLTEGLCLLGTEPSRSDRFQVD